MEWSGKDMYGSFALRREGQIVEASVEGIASARLADWFNQALSDLVDAIPAAPWGYLGDLSRFQAWSKDVEDILAQTHCICVNSGCIVAGYLITNPIAKAQLQSVRDTLGFERGLDNYLFFNHSLALGYIQDVLKGKTKTEAMQGRILMPSQQSSQLVQFISH